MTEQVAPTEYNTLRCEQSDCVSSSSRIQYPLCFSFSIDSVPLFILLAKLQSLSCSCFHFLSLIRVGNFKLHHSFQNDGNASRALRLENQQTARMDIKYFARLVCWEEYRKAAGWILIKSVLVQIQELFFLIVLLPYGSSETFL